MEKTKILRDRTLGFWIGAAAAVLALITAVIYGIYSGWNDTFSITVLILLLAGVVCEGLVFVSDMAFLPALPAIFYGAAFVALILDRIPMFVDYINGIFILSGSNHILWLVILILVLLLICTVGGCISSFSEQRRCPRGENDDRKN